MREEDFELIDDYEEYDADDFGFDFDDFDPQLTIMNEYLNSFIWDNKDLDNRFNRYMKQFKQQMFEAIKKANLMMISLFPDLKISSIEDYIYDTLWMFAENKIMQKEEEIEPNVNQEKSESVFEKIAYNLVQPLEYAMDDETFLHLVKKNRVAITKLINTEFNRVCKEIIALKSSFDEDITEYNFVKYTLPEHEEEYMMYYNQIISRVCENFDALIMIKRKSDATATNEIKKLKTELEKEKKLSMMEKEIEEKTRSLNKLREMQEKAVEEKNRAVKHAVVAYTKENADLNKKIRLMEREIEILKKEPEKKQEPIMKEGKQEKTKEIDYASLRLLFVSSDSSTFANDFKETFPNSKMIYDNFKVDFSKYDFVIVITTHIDHMTYNTMKDKCKNAGTKFLHCTNTNVEKVKELIAKNM